MNGPEFEEAVAFFEQYKNDFDNANWVSFASLLHEPFVSVRGDGSVKFCASRGEAQSFFENVADTWRRESYDRFRTSKLEVMIMGKFSRLVTFDWEMLRADGSVLRKWRQSYQLIATENAWKVLGSTFHAGLT